MRVLLTGHLGYIGTVLTPMLVKAGHDVVGMDSDLYSRCTFAAGGTICDVPTIRKDTRDAALDDLAGFDGVIHLAALSNDPARRPEAEPHRRHQSSRQRSTSRSSPSRQGCAALSLPRRAATTARRART